MRWLLLGVGWASLGLGLVGVVLPGLPTTPFVLLAAFCFSRGSPRLHGWLLAKPGVEAMVRNWRERGAIPRRAKLLATAMMVPTVLTTLFLATFPPAVDVLLLAIVAGVLAFIWTRPS